MRVIICGAGQVGFGIARHLAGEGNDVTVIDQSPELIERIQDTLDVRPIVGHGAHPDVLATADAQNTDILIAVTASDEVNMVTCQVARTLFNIPKTIARVRDRKYLERSRHDLFNNRGIPIDVIISPEIEVANTVMNRIALPGAFDVANFYGNRIQLIGIDIEEDCPVIDTPLSQLTDLFPDLKATVVAVQREGGLFVPRSSDSIEYGDKAFVISSMEDTERTLKIFGHPEKQARRLVLVGGGNIGFELARKLEMIRNRYSVNLIEVNHSRAETIAELLPHTIVLEGSGLAPDVLREAEAGNAELTVVLTNDDQVNILTSMLALQEGCPRTLALINENAFQKLAGQFGMDAAINPRAVTVSSILGHVRRGRIIRVHAIADGAAEVVEAEVTESSPIVGQRLRDIELPSGIRFGMIGRGDEVIMPRGDTEILVGDRVVLFVVAEDVDDVEHIFRVTIDLV
jgi:trk system potassium uptake protein TrkA